MTLLSSALAWASQQLSDAHVVNNTIESPQREARLLLCHVSGFTHVDIISAAERLSLSEQQYQAYQQLITRRADGEPHAYLTGHKEFWSLDFKVTTDTLIPRPETELLVEQAIEQIKKNHSLRVLDLGTGSGAIALAIGSEMPQCTILATDISAAALEVAKYNKSALGIHNVRFIQSDWFSSKELQDTIRLEGAFDLIISNPPYIADDDSEVELFVKAHEPATALFAKDNGLADLKSIIDQSINFLSPTGGLLLEHGHRQSPAVLDLLKSAGFSNVFSVKDLNNIERISIGMR